MANELPSCDPSDPFVRFQASCAALPNELKLMILKKIQFWPGTITQKLYPIIWGMKLQRIYANCPPFACLVPEFFYGDTPVAVEAENLHVKNGSAVYFPPPQINTFIRRLEVHIAETNQPEAMIHFLRHLANGKIGFERLQHLTIVIYSYGWNRHKEENILKKIEKQGGLRFRTQTLEFREKEGRSRELSLPYDDLSERMNSCFGIRTDEDVVPETQVPGRLFLPSEADPSDPCKFTALVTSRSRSEIEEEKDRKKAEEKARQDAEKKARDPAIDIYMDCIDEIRAGVFRMSPEQYDTRYHETRRVWKTFLRAGKKWPYRYDKDDLMDPVEYNARYLEFQKLENMYLSSEPVWYGPGMSHPVQVVNMPKSPYRYEKDDLMDSVEYNARYLEYQNLYQSYQSSWPVWYGPGMPHPVQVVNIPRLL